MVMKAEVKMSAAGANEQLLQKCASKIKKKKRKKDMECVLSLFSWNLNRLTGGSAGVFYKCCF